MTPGALLEWLRRRGGQEFAVRLLPVTTTRSKRHKETPTPPESPLYRLSARGEKVQALGPSGQPRLLSQAAFLKLFGGYLFAAPQATGIMHDLGPLFS